MVISAHEDSTGLIARVSSTSELEQTLTAAVEQLRLSNPQISTKGILVTRLCPGVFSIDFNAEVPHGSTYERFES